MKVTVKSLGKSKFYIQIRGLSPTGEKIRERYWQEHPTRGYAQDWANERLLLLMRGGDDRRGQVTPTLAKLWEDYRQKHIKSERLKPSQQIALDSIWRNHLEPFFGKRRIDQIDFNAVQDFKASRSKKSAKTVNNLLIALKAVLQFAVKQKRLDRAPEIELLKVPKTIAQHYDLETYNKLVGAALTLSDRHAAVVLLGGEAGLRSGEMLALDVADLALPFINLKRNLWRGHMGTLKGNAERMLPLTQRTVAVLERLSQQGPGPVLRSSRGTRLNQTMLVRLLRQAQKAAGVAPLSPHKLRHTYGTDITRTLGIRAAQVLLGHADVKTTERYSHVLATTDVASQIEEARALPARLIKSDAPSPIRSVRMQLGMTEAELAKFVGATQQQIQRIEAGQEPSVSLAIRIAQALKTTPSDLWAAQGQSDLS